MQEISHKYQLSSILFPKDELVYAISLLNLVDTTTTTTTTTTTP